MLRGFGIKQNIPTYSVNQLCNSNIEYVDFIVNNVKPKNDRNAKTDDKIQGLKLIGLKIDKFFEFINNNKKNNKNLKNF